MGTQMPWFQAFIFALLRDFVLAKLATSSIKVKSVYIACLLCPFCGLWSRMALGITLRPLAVYHHHPGSRVRGPVPSPDISDTLPISWYQRYTLLILYPRLPSPSHDGSLTENYVKMCSWHANLWKPLTDPWSNPALKLAVKRTFTT